MAVTERDVLIPALKIIQKNPGCNMSFIIEQIAKEMVFAPEDLLPLANRSDLRYSQIIRNLSSHYDSGNEFSRYVIRESIGNHYVYTLNTDGEQLLISQDFQQLEDDLDEIDDDQKVKNAQPYTTSRNIAFANNRRPNLRDGINHNNRFSTDPRLAQSAIMICGYECQYANIVGEIHPTFNSKRGHHYLEAHHLIPMKAQNDFGDRNLDRTENIVGLCPTCHRAVHYGTLEEKKRILRPLYDCMILGLRECPHHIDISFEELINKYYL